MLLEKSKIRDIISTNNSGPESPMLHTKFHGNLSTGPEKKIFEGK